MPQSGLAGLALCALCLMMRLSMRVWISRNHIRDQTLRGRDNNSGSFDGLISVSLTVARGRGAITKSCGWRETFTRIPCSQARCPPCLFCPRTCVSNENGVLKIAPSLFSAHHKMFLTNLHLMISFKIKIIFSFNRHVPMPMLTLFRHGEACLRPDPH